MLEDQGASAPEARDLLSSFFLCGCPILPALSEFCEVSAREVWARRVGYFAFAFRFYLSLFFLFFNSPLIVWVSRRVPRCDPESPPATPLRSCSRRDGGPSARFPPAAPEQIAVQPSADGELRVPP